MSDKVSMVDQFKVRNEKRKEASKKNPQKGPVDVKQGRAQVKEWNNKNRNPWEK